MKVETARIKKEESVRNSGVGYYLRNFWKCPFHGGQKPKENNLKEVL